MNETERSAEQLFLRYLDQIESLLRIVAHRYALHGDEPEEFGAWVKLKIIEDDYAVLRKFRGEAKLRTYLTTVFLRLAKDWLIAKRGKWRPSAHARRAGVSAVRLETLISYEGRTVEEAVEVVKRNFAASESRDELYRLAEDLPQHPPRSHVSLEAIGEPDAALKTDGAVLASEREEHSAEVSSALASALAELDQEDRLVLEMHFGRGMTVASIARLLDEPQRPLYSRLTRLLKTLRSSLESRDVGLDQVRELFGWVEGGVEVDYGIDSTELDAAETDAARQSSTETTVNRHGTSVPSAGRRGVKRRRP